MSDSLPYRPLPPIKTVTAEFVPPAEKLTAKQYENWRRVLLGIIGPYAHLMSNEEIETYRQRIQSAANCS